MNAAATKARFKSALVLIVFAVLGVGPVPITSTIGLLIVIFRPRWFKQLVDNIYIDKH
jgi:hypothetical protein